MGCKPFYPNQSMLIIKNATVFVTLQIGGKYAIIQNFKKDFMRVLFNQKGVRKRSLEAGGCLASYFSWEVPTPTSSFVIANSGLFAVWILSLTVKERCIGQNSIGVAMHPNLRIFTCFIEPHRCKKLQLNGQCF